MSDSSMQAVVRRVIRKPRLLIAALCVLPTIVSAQGPRVFPATIPNFSFEYAAFTTATGAVTPEGWETGVVGKGVYVVGLDSAQHLDGRMSLRSMRVTGTGADSSNSGAAMAQQLTPLRAAPGSTLRFTGWIRTQDVGNGFAALWLRTQTSQNVQLQFDNMKQRGPTGTTGWTRYVIELPIDSGATSAGYGVQHSGTGTAWFDSVRLEIVAKPAKAGALPAGLLQPLSRPR